MLHFFSVKRVLKTLDVRVFVDVERKEAEVSVRQFGRIRYSMTVPFEEVSTFGMAEDYLGKALGEGGPLIRTLEERYRIAANG
jgi:hypothetical protein